MNHLCWTKLAWLLPRRHHMLTGSAPATTVSHDSRIARPSMSAHAIAGNTRRRARISRETGVHSDAVWHRLTTSPNSDQLGPTRPIRPTRHAPTCAWIGTVSICACEFAADRICRVANRYCGMTPSIHEKSWRAHPSWMGAGVPVAGLPGNGPKFGFSCAGVLARLSCA